MEKIKYHTTLSDYFSVQPLFFDSDLQKKPHIRKCVELPFQQTKAKLWDEITNSLCNLKFIEAKTSANLINDLIIDYDTASEAKEITEALQLNLKSYAVYVRSKSHIISNRSWLVIQEAFNISQNNKVSESANLLIHDPSFIKRPWLRLVNRPELPKNTTLITMIGHEGAVRTHSITQNGKRIISVGEDNSLRIWDINTGKCLSKIYPKFENITELAISPEGSNVFINTKCNGIYLYNLENGQISCLVHSPENYTFMRFFSDPELMILTEDRIQIREIATGKIIREFALPCGITCFTTSLNGNIALAGHVDLSIRVWNLQTGGHHFLQFPFAENRDLGIHVNAIILSTDGRFAVSSSWELQAYQGSVKFWDVESKVVIKSKLFRSQIKAITLTNDNRRVVIAINNQILLWDLESDILLDELSDHVGSISEIKITPDNLNGVSSDTDGLIKVWSLPNGPLAEVHKQDLNSCKFVFNSHLGPVNLISSSKDGLHLLTGSQDGTVKIWDLVSGKCESIMKGKGPVKAAVWSQDDGSIIIARDKTIQVWESGKLKQSVSRHPASICFLTTTWSETSLVVLCKNDMIVSWNTILPKWRLEFLVSFKEYSLKMMTLSVGGQRLVAISKDGYLASFNPSTGVMLNPICTPRMMPSALFVTHDDTVVIGFGDGVVEIWNGMTATKVFSFKLFDSQVVRVFISSKDYLIAVAFENGIVSVFNLSTCQSEFQIEQEPGTISSLVISPNNDMLITGSSNGCIRVYDIYCGNKHNEFRDNKISASEILSDGKRGITASQDGTVRLWDLLTGEPEKQIIRHSASITQIIATPDNKYLVTLSEAQTARLWELNTGLCIKIFRGHRRVFRWGRIVGIKAIALTPDARKLLGMVEWGGLKAWALKSGRFLWLRNIFQYEETGQERVVISPDGRYVATSSTYDKCVKVRRISTGYKSSILEPNRGAYQIAFTPDSKFMLIYSFSGIVDLFEIKTERLIETFGSDEDKIDLFTLTPDGRLVLIKKTKTLEVWNLSPIVLQNKITLAYECESLLCSSDGKYVFLSLLPNILMSFDLATGMEVSYFSANNRISTFTIDSLGKRILLGDATGKVYILEMENFIFNHPIVTGLRRHF